MKVIRKLWRAFLYWRFQLFGRRRFRRTVLERVGTRSFLILPDVFNPKLFQTGEFLARNLDSQRIPRACRVLDMGTGSGIGAVAAAEWAGQVIAVDLNPSAVRCARINALLNGAEERVEVREGDLFAPVADERFDVVLFNPPYFRGTPRDSLEGAFRSGDIAERFATGLADHLTAKGQALLVLSSNGDEKAFVSALDASGFSVEVIAHQDLISEVLRLYLVRRMV